MDLVATDAAAMAAADMAEEKAEDLEVEAAVAVPEIAKEDTVVVTGAAESIANVADTAVTVVENEEGTPTPADRTIEFFLENLVTRVCAQSKI